MYTCRRHTVMISTSCFSLLVLLNSLFSDDCDRRRIYNGRGQDRYCGKFGSKSNTKLCEHSFLFGDVWPCK